MDEHLESNVPRAERRLRAKLPDGEHLVSWTRGWVSRDGRLHTVFAARNRDFCVLTEHHLYLFSTGFFTRRPKRRVYSNPLDRLVVSERKGGRGLQLRVRVREARAMLVDLRPNARSTAFADALLSATQRDRGPE